MPYGVARGATMNRAIWIAAFVLGSIVCSASISIAGEIPTTGHLVAGLEPFDSLMLGFLETHHITGASLAVTRNGRLVYARGFGWADREAMEPVEPQSLFRIASISKPITAVAVLQLYERNKVDLQDNPFKSLKIQPVLLGNAQVDPRLADITVLKLLQHRGGFDRDMSLDPMFQSVRFAEICHTDPPAMQQQIIQVMAGRPLDFAPGSRYAYSNFGYCVLGRVIETASGETYGDYVEHHVFAPLKIEHIRLGHSLLKDRIAGEVRYYTAHGQTRGSVFPPVGQRVPAPYGGFCIEAMDSHGGWVASAAELVKFATALDDPAATEILTQQTVSQMFGRPPGAAGLEGNKPGAPPAAVWYGCGWSVRDVGLGRINTWHEGLLDGTSSLLVRRWDGLDWAVLLNQDRDDNGKTLADQIDPLVHRAADAVRSWPAGLDRNNTWP
jgi:CubicO group peptidase (beta-lactamase class C family)